MRCGGCSADLNNPSLATLSSGERLDSGRYVIASVIGRGGFGITYAAEDASLNCSVAIKELFPAQGVIRESDGKIRALMPNNEFEKLKLAIQREAQTLVRVRHPSVVRLFNIFAQNNTLYLVMEHLSGQTLADRLVTARVSTQELTGMAMVLLDALAAVHQLGILHRDIKPENILLSPQAPVLIDFGNALDTLTTRTAALTQAVLTPAYAAPEQYLTSARLTPAADLYALGATLYHAATGRLPIPALERLQGVELTPINTLAPGFDKGLIDCIEACLNLKIQDRPASASDVSQRLHTSQNSVAGLLASSVTPTVKITQPASPTSAPNTFWTYYPELKIGVSVVLGMIIATIFLQNANNTTNRTLSSNLTQTQKNLSQAQKNLTNVSSSFSKLRSESSSKIFFLELGLESQKASNQQLQGRIVKLEEQNKRLLAKRTTPVRTVAKADISIEDFSCMRPDNYSLVARGVVRNVGASGRLNLSVVVRFYARTGKFLASTSGRVEDGVMQPNALKDFEQSEILDVDKTVDPVNCKLEFSDDSGRLTVR
jgi:serine/threonine protein kinase